jgi:hypothetical protein
MSGGFSWALLGNQKEHSWSGHDQRLCLNPEYVWRATASSGFRMAFARLDPIVKACAGCK